MTKECNECHTTLPLDNYYLVTKRGKKVVYHICKTCCSAKKLKLKKYYRDWELKSKYGISLEEYERVSQMRNNHCDICDKKVKSLHVDHNHTTKQVRGYLCGSCNRALGLFQDSSTNLQNAHDYLKAWEQCATL